jgi:thiamine-phosphate pyrophosphorylase
LLPRIFCLVDVTDDVSVLPELADLGVLGFQIRAKGLVDRDLLEFTLKVRDAVSPYGAMVVVNDRVDIALAAGADGVHLGAGDLPVATARRLAPSLLIGATCRSQGDVVHAHDAGADYVGFGPIFATTSKPDLPAPLGVSSLGDLALPAIAIGGIDASNAGSVIDAGAYGVAVLGAIWRHPDPLQSAKELCTAIG